MIRFKKNEQKTQLEQNSRLIVVRLRRSKKIGRSIKDYGVKNIGRSIKDYGVKFFLIS
jgi:hypothetical protein